MTDISGCYEWRIMPEKFRIGARTAGGQDMGGRPTQQREKRSLMGFAGAYADQTERDYRAFLAASKSGRISARAST